MKRREFITLLCGVAASPLAAHAQQRERVRRLGVLMSVEESDPEGKAQLSGFTQALAQLGWTNGQNLQMEIRWGGGGDATVRATAKSWSRCSPTSFCARTPAAALHHESADNPIICCCDRSGGDGFVAGLPRPGGNITGFNLTE
jgi:putative ABC transport system substrate-binding protein